MSYPQDLFKNIYWAFSNGPVVENTFPAVFQTYHEEISGETFPYNWNAVIFDYPHIALQYVKYTDTDVLEPHVLVKASNGVNFTVRDLLYQVHQVGLVLEDDDNCYFEGLRYTGATYEYEVGGIAVHAPAYFLVTGS